MRIAYLIAGAGGMYCGSCLRDNRVAGTLIARGRDVVVIPLYSPIRTDESQVGTRRIYYGGLSVYLLHAVPFVQFLPTWLMRVLDAPATLRLAARVGRRGTLNEMGPLTVSVLQGALGRHRRELADLIAGLKAIRPDLVSLPNLMFAGIAGSLKDAIGVPIVCTLSGEDVFLDGLPEPFRTRAYELIRERAADIDGFIAVTDYYAGAAAQKFQLPASRVHAVPMGIDPRGFVASSRPSAEQFTVGYLARVSAEKGLARLCEAFATLRRRGRNCRLRAAGYVQDRAYLKGVRSYVRRVGVADGFEFFGELDLAGKAVFLQSLDVFCAPTVYPESKGLYVLEALACGVPVVLPRQGSFPEIVEGTGGGLLYDPHEEHALAAAIVRLMDDAGLREQLGAQGRAAVHASFHHEIMAERTWEVFMRYVYPATDAAGVERAWAEARSSELSSRLSAMDESFRSS